MESLRPLLFLLLGIGVGFLITQLVQRLVIGFKFHPNRTKMNDSLGIDLFAKVRVLCYVNTSPRNHKQGAQAVLRTWGKRCNKLIFFSNQTDPELPGSVALPGGEVRGSWMKTKNALKYLYDHHLADADWFLEVFDDTYMVLENLRYMLYPYSPGMAIFFRSPGTVMSVAALRRLVEKSLPDASKCEAKDTGYTLGKLMKCLENANVVERNSTDSKGCRRMYIIHPEARYYRSLLSDPRFKFWHIFWAQAGISAWSNYPVSFHYVDPSYMHFFEYMIYKLRAFGRKFEVDSLPELIYTTKKDVIKGLQVEAASDNAY